MKKKRKTPLNFQFETTQQNMWTMWWGPDFHKNLKKIACEFPNDPTPQQQKAAKNLVESLFQLLPCKHCRAHACYYLQIHPLTAHSRNAFLDWLVTFHNRLNQRLGKRSNWTTQEALEALIADMQAEREGLDLAQRMRQEDEKKIRKLEMIIQEQKRKVAIQETREKQEVKTQETQEMQETGRETGGERRGKTQTKQEKQETRVENQEKTDSLPQFSPQHECLGAFNDTFSENRETERFTMCVLGFVAFLLFVALGLLITKLR